MWAAPSRRGNPPEAIISGQHQGHCLLCSTLHHPKGKAKMLFRRPPSPPEQSAVQDGGACYSPSPFLQKELPNQHTTTYPFAERALESAHHHPPGHHQPTGSWRSPARPVEGERGPRPRRRAQTASLQIFFERFLCSRSLGTDWNKMAERRGKSKQPAHLTRKYRP